ncbi:hypothetical protein M6D81_24460 [Paenibacillus sp. J5C_2022]|uniref:heparinase II/III family protein n=1 Tax=Paenibacillus sp. J5C2022 TaxID=2977129 RepID=UPI0021D2669D|nr:heparinase II/III family protein [Paenibacillus sp. J5C2022]MCU6711858.1 hypothetical protein [Paenibacillus sp. J5C2022]
MRFVKKTGYMFVALILLFSASNSVYGYEYRYEARLAVMQFYADTSLVEGPVLSSKELYEQLLDDSNSVAITEIIDTYRSGDLELTRNKWHTYFKNKEYATELRTELQLVKSASELTREDVDWDMADRGLSRGHEYNDYAYSFTDEIDWTYNPTYSDPELQTDHGWTWSLNAHEWWVEMAKAAAVSGNAAYAEELAYQMKSWITTQVPGTPSVGQEFHDQHKRYVQYSHSLHSDILDDGSDVFEYELTGPDGTSLTGMSASWRTLETGIRLREWLKTLYYFRESPSFDPELCELVTRSLIDQATWLAIPHHFSEGQEWEEDETSGLRSALAFFPELMLSEEMIYAVEQR